MSNLTFAIIKPDAINNNYTGKIYNHILKEDFEILYKRFGIFFLFVLIYKISIKILGILTKKNIHNKNYINEKNKLI